ncbi:MULTISPECIES: endolytic transglycosylase MltG [unclassified Pseudodesulfovibrio]|uniref:endolytic transglycosylase MltG n=1 Tax=unclassified Pseudodesulfovibrio TaxID=2661612 RepID=UPI000FEBB411|nr:MULTISPECIES: endolytic transglycosylase MltG [unclassified Pseudodesulfovibrio]MCJ2166100.1 endolytic transglycosylase MltG [Pseudodesulfovibrio sp. S3-i]RWU02452.1 endolytic transglycosylase MltG [Pseudodesulfovibrio sp. S3]
MARKRTILIAFSTLFLLAALGAGGFQWYRAWQEQQFLTTPPETPGRDVLFRVEPGQVFTAIAQNLKAEGVISDTRRFYKLAVRTGKGSAVRAGVFALSTGWVPERVLLELTSSTGIMKRVSVREGLTWWQTAKIIEEADLGTYADFAQAQADKELLAAFGIEAKDAEGYLFPETYLLTPPKENPSRFMIRLMLKEFFKNAAKVWPSGLPEFEEMHQKVILASLIEKETGDMTERKRISGVFHNRLKKRMLIQCDPTIIYGLGPDFDGNIKKSDLLDKNNPYNTYAIQGLPPGPICSPGLDALLAAVHPEEHSYLYFVAKGDGSHHFSKNLEEHNQAVRQYQLRRNNETYKSTK